MTPLVVPWITLAYGWYWAFIATGAVGFLWLALWWALYHRPEEHPQLSPGELAYIKSDPPDPVVRVAWCNLMRHRQTWAFALGKFLTDPIWWLYLFGFLISSIATTGSRSRLSARRSSPSTFWRMSAVSAVAGCRRG